MHMRTALDEIRLEKQRPTRTYVQHVADSRDRMEDALYRVIVRHLLAAKRDILAWAQYDREIHKAANIPPDPASPNYWDAWMNALADDLNATLTPLLMSIFNAEMTITITPPPGFVVSTAAVSAAQQYTYNLITSMTATQQTRMQNVMSAYYGSGGEMGMRDLRIGVGDIFGPDRADLIATTEATRISATSRLQFYAARSVRQLEWRTARDWVVCKKICQPLDGTRIDLANATDANLPPDASHPGCRCSVVPVNENSQRYNPIVFPDSEEDA